jgi:hypothetical protein
MYFYALKSSSKVATKQEPVLFFKFQHSKFVISRNSYGKPEKGTVKLCPVIFLSRYSYDKRVIGTVKLYAVIISRYSYGKPVIGTVKLHVVIFLSIYSYVNL